MAKTISEIAEANNISVTTVKLIINGNANKYRISKKTQKKIQDYIEEHGCIVNQAARSLKLQKTETLGFIVPDLRNPFYAELSEVMSDFCIENKYQLITAFTKDNEQTEERATQTLISRGVDGLFLIPTSRKMQVKLLKTIGDKPVVFIDRDFDCKNTTTILSDNYLGNFQLTRTILKKAETDLVYFCGDPQSPVIKNRLSGFIDANKAAGNKQYEVIHAQYNTEEDGVCAMSSFYDKRKSLPRSIMFSSLPLLEGALHYLKSTFGIISSNVIIGTFDEHTMLDFLPHNVISVQQDIDKIARTAIEVMLKKLNNEEVKDIDFIIPPLIIEREKEPTS